MAGEENLEMVMSAPEQEEQGSNISREQPDPSDERAALISKLCSRVTSAKKAHNKAFKRMDECMEMTDGKLWSGGGAWTSDDDDRYTANLLQRHVHQRTSALYAKNPTIVAQRRRRRAYKVWDGNMQSIAEAQMFMQQALMGAASGMAMSMGISPQQAQQMQQAAMLLEDYNRGQEEERMYAGVADTLEILSDYFQHEQIPRFKLQMKQAVRRAIINGVAYAKLTFQRKTGKSPELLAQLADMRNDLARAEQLAADEADDVITDGSSEIEQLRLVVNNLTEQLEQDGEIILREGPVWTFPKAQRLIVDPNCYELLDFVGAEWVAEEYILTREQVQQIYGKDVSNGHKRYSYEGAPEVGEGSGRSSMFDPADQKAKDDGLVCVWEVYDKSDGLLYVIADGYKEFLREPKRPPLELEQFYPYFTLTFNQLESTDSLYPQSDVWLLRHAQREFNRLREANRQARYAARPLYVAAPGWADEDDQESMAGHPAHGVITLKNLLPGQKAEDMVRPFPKIGVDPNLYETASVFDDFQRVVGTQEANLGGTAGATATETSIAESSRMSSLGSQSDDLDDMLTAMKRAEGQVMMSEMSLETVVEIVGQGAVWPQASAADIAKEITLEVEAGSSGRPNQATEVQMFQQMVPLLIQIPGVMPDKLAEVGLKIMDSRFRVSDFMDSSLPSIVAMNAMAGGAGAPATGDPATDPAQQGRQGANNAPQPDQGGDIPGASGPPPAGLMPV